MIVTPTKEIAINAIVFILIISVTLIYIYIKNKYSNKYHKEVENIVRARIMERRTLYSKEQVILYCKNKRYDTYLLMLIADALSVSVENLSFSDTLLETVEMSSENLTSDQKLRLGIDSDSKIIIPSINMYINIHNQIADYYEKDINRLSSKNLSNVEIIHLLANLPLCDLLSLRLGDIKISQIKELNKNKGQISGPQK